MNVRIAAAAALVLLGACTFSGPREVLPGRLYLSGQPDAAQCEAWVRRLGLRSIVNLRGPDLARSTYRAEKDCTERMGVRLLDLPFLASETPPPALLRRFLREFPSLEEPILVHCRSGVDRSSLGVFIVLTLWDRPFEEAASWVRSLARHRCPRDCPQRRFVADYEAWCAGEGRTPGAAALREFAEKAYCPDPYRRLLVVDGMTSGTVAGSTVRFTARAVNTGPGPWTLTARPDRGVRLGGRLYGPLPGRLQDPESYYYDHRDEGVDLFRAGLEEDRVMPGESREWSAAFSAPEKEGAYLLAVDLVDEGRAWFSDHGLAPLLFPLEVTAAPGRP